MGFAREELLTIDQIRQRHRFVPERVDNVLIVQTTGAVARSIAAAS